MTILKYINNIQKFIYVNIKIEFLLKGRSKDVSALLSIYNPLFFLPSLLSFSFNLSFPVKIRLIHFQNCFLDKKLSSRGLNSLLFSNNQKTFPYNCLEQIVELLIRFQVELFQFNIHNWCNYLTKSILCSNKRKEVILQNTAKYMTASTLKFKTIGYLIK